VVDLRHNGGGDNTTYGPLLSAVRAAGAEPGRLYLLTDRLTFSAAANFVTEVEQTTPVTIVGEPMGGGLNFWDDVTRVELRNLPVPMDVGISVRYWQKSEPDDPRLTIEPQIPVPTRAADYFAGRDPVLEAALAAPS
jgi:C-terminal processing protease CtpA/Prc